MTARFRYGAFGQPFASNSTATRFTFAGHQFDVHSGLYYARQRYYDPSTGRFLGEDPMLAVNPYPYAANDPIDLIDPSGAQPFIETAERDEQAGAESQGARNLGSRICQRIGQCVAKINNLKEHLTPEDLDAARRAAQGEHILRADGTPFQHIQEVQDAQAGLLNAIQTLIGILCNPSATAEERQAAQKALGDASRMLDKSEGYLPR